MGDFLCHTGHLGGRELFLNHEVILMLYETVTSSMKDLILALSGMTSGRNLQ
jgi:hypothetical protein